MRKLPPRRVCLIGPRRPPLRLYTDASYEPAARPPRMGWVHCKDLPPKSQCKNNRVRECEFRESADHKSKDCPKKPKFIKW